MIEVNDPSLRFDTVSPAALEGKFERNRHLLPAFAGDATDAADLPKLSEDEAVDRAQGCLLGLAIGEAIGSAVEYLPRDGFEALQGMQGGGPLELVAGQWTDGMAMALCLGHSLVASETMEQFDFMLRLQAWLQDGENACQGKCVAVGDTTRTAIESFIEDEEPSAGLQDAESAGNGSLIRLAPVAIFARSQPEAAKFFSGKQSRTTHATHECLDACELLTAQLVDALNGADKETTLRPRIMQLSPNTLSINGGEYKEKARDDVRSSAYVIDTLDAALWAVWTSASFEEAVLKAANLGGDPGSIAAVAGQLAGAIHGCNAIPAKWKSEVVWDANTIDLAVSLLKEGANALQQNARR